MEILHQEKKMLQGIVEEKAKVCKMFQVAH
jgi:hypothetical protein